MAQPTVENIVKDASGALQTGIRVNIKLITAGREPGFVPSDDATISLDVNLTTDATTAKWSCATLKPNSLIKGDNTYYQVTEHVRGGPAKVYNITVPDQAGTLHAYDILTATPTALAAILDSATPTANAIAGAAGSSTKASGSAHVHPNKLPTYTKAALDAVTSVDGALALVTDNDRAPRVGTHKQWVSVGASRANVRMFGGIFDGNSHLLSERYPGDLAAAQAAYPNVAGLALTDEIDYAATEQAIATNDIVYTPGGTGRFNKVPTMRDNLVLDGAGWMLAIWKFNSGLNGLNLTARSLVTVRNMRFDSLGGAGSIGMLCTNASRLTVQNVMTNGFETGVKSTALFMSPKFDNFRAVNGAGNAIDLTRAIDCELTRIETDHEGVGIKLTQCQSVGISRWTPADNTRFAEIYKGDDISANIVFERCFFDNFTLSPAIQALETNIFNVTFEDCEFVGSTGTPPARAISYTGAELNMRSCRFHSFSSPPVLLNSGARGIRIDIAQGSGLTDIDDVVTNNMASGDKHTLAFTNRGHRLTTVATADLPAAGANNNGLALVEDAGGALANLVFYAKGRRYKIVGVEL